MNALSMKHFVFLFLLILVACTTGIRETNEYRCYGNTLQQLYANGEYAWRDVKQCAQGCEFNRCVGEPVTEVVQPPIRTDIPPPPPSPPMQAPGVYYIPPDYQGPTYITDYRPEVQQPREELPYTELFLLCKELVEYTELCIAEKWPLQTCLDQMYNRMSRIFNLQLDKVAEATQKCVELF